MKIANIMSREVKLINPDDTLRDAATLMKTIDAGHCRWPKAIG